MSDPRANNVLVETLGTSLRYGGSALADVPDLLRKVLQDNAWRDFVTRRGEHIHHETWTAFVTTSPLEGLGADVATIDRIIGTADPDLLRMLREARTVGRGHKRTVESTVLPTGEDAALTAQRLSVEAPAEYEAVQRGERSIHAAAVRAGIRRHRIPVRLDSAESAAQSLRAHMEPETRHALGRLLMED